MMYSSFSMRCRFCIVLLFLWIFSMLPSKATNEIDKIVADLREQWLCYEPAYASYVPCIGERHKNTQTIHFWLKPTDFLSYPLCIALREDTYLYINHHLQKKYKKGWQKIDLDSLQKQYPTAKSLFFTLYSTETNFIESTIIGTLREQHATKISEVKLKKINFAALPEQVSWLIAILLVGYTFLWYQDPKILVGYLQITKFFQIQRRADNPVFFRMFQNNNILFFLLYSCTTASVFSILAGIAPQSNESFNLHLYGISVSKSSILYTLIWAGIVVGWMILKYVLLTITANLLGVSKLINVHFYEYIRVSHVFYLLLLVLLSLLALNKPHEIVHWYGFFKISLMVFYIFRIFTIAYNTNRWGDFRKLDFFSYLCISEVIPVTIYLKILFFN